LVVRGKACGTKPFGREKPEEKGRVRHNYPYQERSIREISLGQARDVWKRFSSRLKILLYNGCVTRKSAKKRGGGSGIPRRGRIVGTKEDGKAAKVKIKFVCWNKKTWAE